jgi:hypothetical protein
VVGLGRKKGKARGLVFTVQIRSTRFWLVRGFCNLLDDFMVSDWG